MKVVKQYLNVMKYILLELLFTFLLIQFFLSFLVGKYYIKYDLDNDIIHKTSEITGDNFNYPNADYIKYVIDTGYDWPITIYRNGKIIAELKISFNDSSEKEVLANKFDKLNIYYYIIFGILISIKLLIFILLIRYCCMNL